jgi:RNA polymerase sigma-70 factor (ECF subfamily)
LFQSGDSRAFEDLYSRYFQRIYRYCLKRVGDPHEAEELAQEAFTRAFCAMPRLGGERRFYPWLTVIASRLCVDTHRRRGRTSPTDQVELGVVEGGQEEILENVDRELLTQALERVTPRHREVLRLREEEGWSYERIAEHLGVRIGTIEALLFRARRALRREFHNLAGADSRLAGLPVIGWVLRRVLESRSRLADLAGQAAPLAAAGAMSVAIVVGGAIGGSALGGASSRATHVVSPVVDVQLPALTLPSAVDGVHVQAPGSASPALDAPRSSDTPLGPTGGQLGFTTPEKAKAQADQMPIHLNTPPVAGHSISWGADPGALAPASLDPVFP